MNKERIDYLRNELENERISYGELHEIQVAFDELIKKGVKLRDHPDHAMASDMLDELEDHLTHTN